jgi:tetratricopeptide (TPR) repeat protein
MDSARIMLAASGWLELGLPGGALEELERLPAPDQQLPAALELKLQARMKCRDWNAAADLARLLCVRLPHEPRYFIHAAYCLHETGDTFAARNQLLSGPKALLEIPLFHYNLACYLWTLGQAERARTHLSRAIAMDESYREAALNDRDLADIGPVA